MEFFRSKINNYKKTAGKSPAVFSFLELLINCYQIKKIGNSNFLSTFRLNLKTTTTVKKQLLIISMVLMSTGYSQAQSFDTLATFMIPNQLALGVAFDYVHNYYVISSGGQSNTLITDNFFLRYDLNFNLVDSILEPQGTTSGFGIRDLAFDGTYIYGSYDNQVQQFDATTLQPVGSFTGLNNPNRGMAVDTDLTVFSSDFTTGPIAHFSNTGATIASCPATSVSGNAPYGLAVDNWTQPGTKRLWLNTPSIAGSIFLTRYDYASCAIDSSVDLSAKVPATSTIGVTTSGGLDIINNHPNYPGKIVGLVLGQDNPTAFIMLVDMNPSPVGIAEHDKNGNSGLTNLYPNPVKDQLSFTWNAKENSEVTVSIHDYLGREVLSQLMNTLKGESKMTLDLSKQTSGVYFITIRSYQSIVTSKFVKE